MKSIHHEPLDDNTIIVYLLGEKSRDKYHEYALHSLTCRVVGIPDRKKGLYMYEHLYPKLDRYFHILNSYMHLVYEVQQ